MDNQSYPPNAVNPMQERIFPSRQALKSATVTNEYVTGELRATCHLGVVGMCFRSPGAAFTSQRARPRGR